MKEPWFNISWSKLAGFLAFAGLLLNQLRTAPLPEKYKPWVEFAAGLSAALVGFMINPKDKPWVPDAQPVATIAPPAPSVGLTSEQAALIAQMLQKGQGQ
jgi:hypothetical protein